MEKDFAEKVVARLSSWFNVQPEITSRCRRYRIDYILSHKKRFNTYFGIEFKDYNHKRGMNLGEHIDQSMRYARAEFEVDIGMFKRIPIFICPPISYTYLMCPVPESKQLFKSAFPQSSHREYFHDRHPKNCTHHTVNGMLGALGMGEVRTMMVRENQYLYFSFSNKMIWTNIPKWHPRWNPDKDQSEIVDIHEKFYPELMKKVNLWS